MKKMVNGVEAEMTADEEAAHVADQARPRKPRKKGLLDRLADMESRLAELEKRK